MQQGFDYFVMADRDTNRKARTFSTPALAAPGLWRLRRLLGPVVAAIGAVVSAGVAGTPGSAAALAAVFGGPWGNDFDVRTIDRYEATAEIVMRKGPIPRDNIRAFDARRWSSRSGRRCRLPEQRTR